MQLLSKTFLVAMFLLPALGFAQADPATETRTANDDVRESKLKAIKKCFERRIDKAQSEDDLYHEQFRGLSKNKFSADMVLTELIPYFSAQFETMEASEFCETLLVPRYAEGYKEAV